MNDGLDDSMTASPSSGEKTLAHLAILAAAIFPGEDSKKRRLMNAIRDYGNANGGCIPSVLEFRVAAEAQDKSFFGSLLPDLPPHFACSVPLLIVNHCKGVDAAAAAAATESLASASKTPSGGGAAAVSLVSLPSAVSLPAETGLIMK